MEQKKGETHSAPTRESIQCIQPGIEQEQCCSPQFNPWAHSLLCSGYDDADSCKKTGDKLPAEKKVLNEDKIESYENQGSQISISEKQMTADKFPVEGAFVKLPRIHHRRIKHASAPSDQSYAVPRLHSEQTHSLKRLRASKHEEIKVLGEKYPLNSSYRPTPLSSFIRIPPPCQHSFKESFKNSSTIDLPDQPPPDTVRGIGTTKNSSSAADAKPRVSQENTRETETIAIARPFNLQISTKKDDIKEIISKEGFSFMSVWNDEEIDLFPTPTWDKDILHPSSPSYRCEPLSVQSDSDALMEMEASATAMNSLVAKTLPAQSHLQSFSSDSCASRRNSGCLPRSQSIPSLRQTSANSKTLTRAKSLPDVLLKGFTPEITLDINGETYMFQCSYPGLYQCSVTGLVFHMEGEGDVVYRVAPWDRRQLAQHHKQPAGPLFDIECQQKSVCQLHLPHCEIRSTGGCDFLSVAHVNHEGIEFIAPHKITETHVVINITGFSAFGNVKDEDSPPNPVRALVLLFYKPPEDPDPESILNVLLLPRNVVLQHVLRIRKKLFRDENYIETSPHCKLLPKQEYTLSTCPEDDSILVQPTEAEFDSDNYDNYFPSFQVSLEKVMKCIKLFLRHTDSSNSVWERKVCLSSTGRKRLYGQSALNLSPQKKLFEMRSSFIDGISGPVLKSLLDKLFEKKVINESERESADETQNRGDKARCVIDTVRKKGEAASKEMIEFLCELDSFLCEHLGLI